jgi:polyisoprenoid-binding protein YceI
MVSKVRGRFTKVNGAIHVAEDPAESWVDAVRQSDDGKM